MDSRSEMRRLCRSTHDQAVEVLLKALAQRNDALDERRARSVAAVAPGIEGVRHAHQLAALDTRHLRDDQHWHREYDVVIGEPGRRVLHDASRRGTEAARAALDDETVLMRIFAADRVLHEVAAQTHVMPR